MDRAAKIVPEDRANEESKVRSHLEAYMAAFLESEQEYIREFEEAGVACWSNADRPNKR